jgi:hypothetical protein
LDAVLLISGAAAIGFPVIFVLLVPLRTYVIPRLSFTQEELFILDGPTGAASSFVSISLLYSPQAHALDAENGMNLFMSGLFFQSGYLALFRVCKSYPFIVTVHSHVMQICLSSCEV